MKKVVSTQVAFIGGRRIRPGVTFEIPDDHKLGAGMSLVDEGKAAKKADAKGGDTKPADAAAAAKAKATGPDQGKGGDTKPADAAAAAQVKAGGSADSLV